MVELPSCIEVDASRAPASASVIWLHGLGADGHDFEPIVPMLRLPHARFVFPHAPTMPVTINAGMIMRAWYDISSLEPGAKRENEAQVYESADVVRALVDREQQRGIPSQRIVLAGFSQGGAMALHVGLRHPAPLAGIVVLSAYLLVPDRLRDEASAANHSTPMLFCHGTRDPLVSVEGGRQAHRTMVQHGHDAQWHEFPIEHEVSVDEIELVGAWLRDRLPPSS